MSDEYDWSLADSSSLVQKGICQRLAVVVQPIRACHGPEADYVSVVSECHDASTSQVFAEEGTGPKSSIAMGPRLLAVACQPMDEDDTSVAGQHNVDENATRGGLLDNGIRGVSGNFDPSGPIGGIS